MGLSSSLLDVEQITRNMREHHTGVLATLATRFPPFVKSRYGDRLHKTAAVRVNWRSRDEADALAVFGCGGSTSHPLFAEDDALECASTFCPRCFPERTS